MWYICNNLIKYRISRARTSASLCCVQYILINIVQEQNRYHYFSFEYANNFLEIDIDIVDPGG